MKSHDHTPLDDLNLHAYAKQRGADKLSRIPIKVDNSQLALAKPSWLRVKMNGANIAKFYEMKAILRQEKLVTVCEEAACPNIAECFGHGTATFMIMGDKCTRRCPFCDVAHGRPDQLDPSEPERLARTVAKLNLDYVVVTSVDRDDLRDGGAEHFALCIEKLRAVNPHTKIEILVPDFRGRIDKALAILIAHPPDVFNHNIETVPRLYLQARPGSDYWVSLGLLKRFKELCPNIPTKSGLMVGLGETDEEIFQVMQDMLEHNIDMITIGQYLAPSTHHLPVKRFVSPEIFEEYKKRGYAMGFQQVFAGPLVRSSYNASEQSRSLLV